jgi:membrane peptidoglycan carboxypeptidase
VQETKLEKVERKVQEWYLAVQIEKVVEKDDILESY